MNYMDRMLGITGPLDAQGERDANLYCRYVRNMRRERPAPHLRLHYNPRFAGYPWSVHMVRDMRPNRGPPNTTNQHRDAAGALRAARWLWFPR